MDGWMDGCDAGCPLSWVGLGREMGSLEAWTRNWVCSRNTYSKGTTYSTMDNGSLDVVAGMGVRMARDGHWQLA